MAKKKRVAIVGGGVSGLVAIQACLEKGLEPVCFESSDGCGGLWRGRGEYDTAAYDSLHIRTDVNHGSFMGLALPSELRSKWFCQWINGGAHIDVVAKYIEAFVAKFGLDKYVRFNTTVVKVEKRGDGWRVQTEAVKGKGNGKSPGRAPSSPAARRRADDDEQFDAVFVCAGRQTTPNTPKIPGQSTFKGTQMHSRDYKSPKKNGLLNKKVLIVGVGNSGCDIACDLCCAEGGDADQALGRLEGRADKVYLGQRSASWLNSDHVGLKVGGPWVLAPLRWVLTILGQLVVFVCAMFEFHLWVGRTPAWSLPFWFRRDAIHFWHAAQFVAIRRNSAQFSDGLSTTSAGT